MIDFVFFGVDTIVTFSPLAETYRNKLQEVGEIFDNLRNSTISILNSKLLEKGKNEFKISGTLIGEKQKFRKIDINLMVFTNIQNEKTEVLLNCSIIDVIDNNYTLNCEREKKDTNYDLQNAISFIGDELMILVFDEGVTSKITFENEIKYYRFGYSKKTGNLGAGSIIAIILVIIAVIAAVIITYKLLKKNKIRPLVDQSSEMKLNI